MQSRKYRRVQDLLNNIQFIKTTNNEAHYVSTLRLTINFINTQKSGKLKTVYAGLLYKYIAHVTPYMLDSIHIYLEFLRTIVGKFDVLVGDITNIHLPHYLKKQIVDIFAETTRVIAMKL